MPPRLDGAHAGGLARASRACARRPPARPARAAGAAPGRARRPAAAHPAPPPAGLGECRAGHRPGAEPQRARGEPLRRRVGCRAVRDRPFAARGGDRRGGRGGLRALAGRAGGAVPPVGRQPDRQSVAAALVVGAALAFRRHQQALEVRRRLLAERAVADERRRIARELHDIVAHHLTTMQLMAGGARANLGGDQEVVREALTVLEGSGRTALREMRQLLDVLRADDEPQQAVAAPQPGVGDLARLVEESCLAGLPTELTVSGAQRPLPPSTALAVFRVVQESLTNARKHAGGARARVHLTYRPEQITVEVRNTGTGGTAPRAAGAGRGGGYGLIGMRERVALHGGSLVAGQLDDGGFGVAADLPLVPVEGEELPV
ncbi:hypothetical protein C7C46_00540 [Streptomyces tateyamensis]|uniref:histidine kinase n=1 Tax=Streptomyces tateyamensis TaxID=565073 RepID=A0A2V4PB41_9ACTN|nr:hypothetical protein C7C46_00540 [Streptomyces tateyamensis]